uniref:Transcription factor IIIC subunit 5 HTH domain-containing protein n=1 Tax=Arcella intermedia TaxID=1963864 RepID=A0A6B2L250_9EUKA
MPTQNYLCVEYPGFIKNMDRALSTLGGAAAINQAHKENSKFLALNLKPDIVHSHPIYGDKIMTSNMILKVVRPLESKLDYKCEMIGLVNNTYRFKGLSDFQYFPSVSNESKRMEEEPNKQPLAIPEETELKLIPPLWSRQDLPHSYNFTENPLFLKSLTETDGEVQEIYTIKKKGFQPSTSFVSFDVENVPTEQPNVSQAQVEKALLDILGKLFEERPAWSRVALEMNIPTKYVKKLKATLPKVAYHFTDGPWRNCWVKYGYDPRKNAESRVFQVIDFRVPAKMRLPLQDDKKWEKPRRQRKSVNIDVGKLSENTTEFSSERNTEEYHTFSRPPINRQNCYQLIDLKLPGIQKLLSKHTKSCTRTSGWLKSSTLKNIRALMMEKLKKMLDVAEGKEENEVEKETVEPEEVEDEEEKGEEVEKREDMEIESDSESELEEEPQLYAAANAEEPFNQNQLFSNFLDAVQQNEDIVPFTTLEESNLLLGDEE